MAERIDHIVKYRLRRLFPGTLMEEDEELIEFLKWHNDTANYRYEQKRLPISRFDDDLNDRFITVVDDLTNARLITSLYEDELLSPPAISRELGIPLKKVRNTCQGESLPHSISYKSFIAWKNKRRRLSEDELMIHLGNYVAHLEADKITIPNSEPTDTFQDLIYLSYVPYFTKSFTGFKWRRAFQNLKTTWYMALIRKFVELPRLRGEEPLRIEYYGNRPLSKGMFAAEIEGKWDYPDDRIDVINTLAEHGISQRVFFKDGNPLNRDFQEILRELKIVYGSWSFWIALIEAGVLTPKNYEEYRSKHPTLKMSQEKVEEIYRKSRILIRQSRGIELLKRMSEGYSLQDANTMLGLNLDRKELMLCLYLTGYPLEEIGEIIRNKNNNRRLTRERVRQIIDPANSPLSEDERTFHMQAREEGRVVQQQLDRLYSEFEQIGITSYILDKLVEAYANKLDETRLSILVGCDLRLLKRYLGLKRMKCLSTEEADLVELNGLHNNGVMDAFHLGNYIFYPNRMVKHSRDTRNLYERTRKHWGTYEIALEKAGIHRLKNPNQSDMSVA